MRIRPDPDPKHSSKLLFKKMKIEAKKAWKADTQRVRATRQDYKLRFIIFNLLPEAATDIP